MRRSGNNIEVYSHGRLVYVGGDINKALDKVGKQVSAQYVRRQIMLSVKAQNEMNPREKRK